MKALSAPGSNAAALNPQGPSGGRGAASPLNVTAASRGAAAPPSGKTTYTQAARKKRGSLVDRVIDPAAPGRSLPEREVKEPPRGLFIDIGSVQEISSSAPNPQLIGIGSGPGGATSDTYIAVPDNPTLSADNRYLYRLAVASVAAGEVLEIVGFRQGVLIGVKLDPEQDTDEPTFVTIEQTTPSWRFPDGNISWHLRWWPSDPRTSNPTPKPRLAPSYYQFDYYGSQPGLLAKSFSPYLAPGQGMPPGQPVSSLGFFTDLRAPMYAQGTAASQSYRVIGPANVGMFCSVKQTNPERPGRASPPPESGSYLPPETQFLAAYPNAQYVGVAGSLLYRVRTK